MWFFLLVGCVGKTIDFDEAGAVSGADGSTAVAFKNTALLNQLFTTLATGVSSFTPARLCIVFSAVTSPMADVLVV